MQHKHSGHQRHGRQQATGKYSVKLHLIVGLDLQNILYIFDGDDDGDDYGDGDFDNDHDDGGCLFDNTDRQILQARRRRANERATTPHQNIQLGIPNIVNILTSNLGHTARCLQNDYLNAQISLLEHFDVKSFHMIASQFDLNSLISRFLGLTELLVEMTT